MKDVLFSVTHNRLEHRQVGQTKGITAIAKPFRRSLEASKEERIALLPTYLTIYVPGLLPLTPTIKIAELQWSGDLKVKEKQAFQKHMEKSGRETKKQRGMEELGRSQTVIYI